MSTSPVSVLVAGLGNMGMSHAKAYAANPGFAIAGLVNRSPVALPDSLCGFVDLVDSGKQRTVEKPAHHDRGSQRCDENHQHDGQDELLQVLCLLDRL